MRVFLTLLAGLMIVSACARYDEEAITADVDEYDHAPATTSEDKPLGPIFGEGYVQ